ncbi:hypothetical protein [Variovorax sp. LT1R16]|uniref:hypothetical protein n=1 Tax=Variovorax sp. LT1R16 TaxID=3443728 RepID=UPI003F47A30A
MTVPEFCFLWLDWWPFCMTKSEWSGWAQAIFSVAAIVAAVWISERQQRKLRQAELRGQTEIRLALVRSCYLACDEAAQTMLYIARNLRSNVGKPFRLRTERVVNLLSSFQTLLSKDVPPELLRDLLTVQRELSYSEMALRQLWSANLVSAKRASAAEDRAARVSAALDALRNRHQLSTWLESQREPGVAGAAIDLSEMLE